MGSILRAGLIGAALSLVALAISLPAYSDCSPSSAPQVSDSTFGSAWWSSYKAWCRGCGGTICDYYNDCGASCKLPSTGASGNATAPSLSTGNPNTPITNAIMSAMPAPTSLGQAFSDGIASGFLGALEQGANAPQLTPEQLRAQQEEQERERQAEIAREQEIAKEKQEKVAKLDHQAFEELSLLDSPFNTSKAVSHDSKPSVKCTDDQHPPGDFICHVTWCGGGSPGPSVCCPSGYPELNQCDCQCYPENSNFACSSYSACENSANFNTTKSSSQGK